GYFFRAWSSRSSLDVVPHVPCRNPLMPSTKRYGVPNWIADRPPVSPLFWDAPTLGGCASNARVEKLESLQAIARGRPSLRSLRSPPSVFLPSPNSLHASVTV